MNLFDLTGKTAIVTGGNNGLLGPIWVETLKDAGASVSVFDLPEYNVARIDDVRYFRTKVAVPDIIINNSAIDNPPTSKASFFGNFEEILKVNLTGAVNVCDVFMQDMIRNGGGVIVNIGSIQGSRGAIKQNYVDGFEKPLGYNLSKAALVQLSRSITTQYGDKNIRSVTIAFGPVENPKLDKEFISKFLKYVPLGRTISKESLQTALLFACCCPELSGQLVLVDGGFCS